ncbi:MAG: peptide deformylase [Candidatus Omnitrophica bacterium]|nr:peptide deformylase [Candidatus Omnitrophota bacterium]
MSETALKIRLFPDPCLRKKCSPVAKVTAKHRDILSKMAQAMYDGMGIGLAAPQVGINEQMIVVDIGSGLYKLINPKVVKKQGTQKLSEGCLSIPEVCVKVRRARKVKVCALGEDGKALDIEAEDLLACVLQHEIDHLKGNLIIDYASLLEKLKIKTKLAGLKKLSKKMNAGLGARACQLEL